MPRRKSSNDNVQPSLPGFEPPPAPPEKQPPLDPESWPVPEKLGDSRLRFGTSSWTYPGWSGLVYRDVPAYGSTARFNQLCLAEYARDPRFRTVGADNMYYVAPASRAEMLRRMRQQLDAGAPIDVDVCPKVWHEITVHRYTALQKDQWRLSTDINRGFLDPAMFLDEVALPFHEILGPHLGPLILEIQENDLAPDAFADTLDRFLSAALPRLPALRIAVELRTLPHFSPRYLDVLAAHGPRVTHALNSWTRMPPIGWQYARLVERAAARGASYVGGFVLCRALLAPGTVKPGPAAEAHVHPGSKYAEAVEAFEPYDKLARPLPQVRSDILRAARELDHLPQYIIVNNRLEGHAPGTIAALQRELGYA